VAADIVGSIQDIASNVENYAVIRAKRPGGSSVQNSNLEPQQRLQHQRRLLQGNGRHLGTRCLHLRC
jgi:hypothetical protein